VSIAPFRSQDDKQEYRVEEDGAAMTVTVGQMLDGKYRIVRLLGKGGMGAVYEGENTLISRRVAIKLLHADLTHKKDMVTRFALEAQAAGKIQNEHINEVIDLGMLEDGSRYIVLEFLEGETLKDRVKRLGKLTQLQAVHIVRQVLIGLSAAHRARIIHRDLKPGNIFILWEKLGQRDFVKIIDFGVSKFLLSRESEELEAAHANTVLGTPHYMAPEQLRRSSDVDSRADLYSTGVILYRAITGRVPYKAKNVRELLEVIGTFTPPSVSEFVSGIDPGLQRVIEKAIRSDVSARFQTADQFLAEIDLLRMETTAAELPCFTDDGLVSTMQTMDALVGSHDASARPGLVAADGDSISRDEHSEHSSIRSTTIRTDHSSITHQGVAAPTQHRDTTSPRKTMVAAVAIAAAGVIAAGGLVIGNSLRSTGATPVEPQAPVQSRSTAGDSEKSSSIAANNEAIDTQPVADSSAQPAGSSGASASASVSASAVAPATTTQPRKTAPQSTGTQKTYGPPKKPPAYDWGY